MIIDESDVLLLDCRSKGVTVSCLEGSSVSFCSGDPGMCS